MPVKIIKQKAFNDFEALQDVVQDRQSEVVQLKPGKMTGSVVHMAVDSMVGISTGGFSKGVRARGILSDTRWCLGMLLKSSGPAVGHGSEFMPGDLAFGAPGEERYIRFADETSYLATFIDPQELQDFLATTAGANEELARLRMTVLTTTPACAEANLSRARPLLEALAEHGPVMSDGAVKFYRDNLLDLLTAPLRDRSLYKGARPIAAESLVRQVDDYSDEVGDRPVHIAEICERLNIHRRTLHRAFDFVLAVSPIDFLRSKRLAHVHLALLQGGPDTKIKDVAREHGFLDLSRFAAAYRRLFGEFPSETLRRIPMIALFALVCQNSNRLSITLLLS